MAGHGGARPGAGRKPGSKNKRTRKNIDEAAAAGQSPVEYLLEVMRDPTAEPHRRDQAARDVCPYVHPKLMAVGPRSDGSGSSDLFVTQIVVAPIPSGCDASGKPFNFAANRPRVAAPLLETVEIAELVDEEPDDASKGPQDAA